MEKIKQMQPMWLCILSDKQFEETSENTQWRKVKQMQPMLLCILLGRSFEVTFENALGEKPKKCKQCDFASSGADTLRMHLKTHSAEKLNKCNLCDYKISVKRQINAASVTLHPIRLAIWGHIWKTYMLKKKSDLHWIYRVTFLTGPALKVLSVGDGKIPTKKVKVRECHRNNLKFNSNFHFFSRDFAISNT